MISPKKVLFSVCLAGSLVVPGSLSSVWAGPGVAAGKAPVCDEVGRSTANAIQSLVAQSSADPGNDVFMNALAQTLLTHLGANCDCVEEIATAAYTAVNPENSAALASVSGQVDNKITDTILGHCGSGYASALAEIFYQVRGIGGVYGDHQRESALALVTPVITPVAPEVPPLFDGEDGRDQPKPKPAADSSGGSSRQMITTPPPVSPTTGN